VAALVTVRRYQVALDREVTGNAGEEVLSWRFFRRAGDKEIELQALVSAGSFGVRLDGGPDLVTLTTGTSGMVEAVSLVAIPAGVHTLRLVAKEPLSKLELLEVHTASIEVR
jgi:hypothetical protein